MDRPSDSDFGSFTGPGEHEAFGWLREHPDSFFLDGQVLHRATCARGLAEAAADSDDFFGPSVAEEALELERFAMQCMPGITFCPECRPPSAYFDLSEFTTCERRPKDRRARRRENCRRLPWPGP